MRYYIGVDWGDEEHAVWVEDEQGQRVSAGSAGDYSVRLTSTARSNLSLLRILRLTRAEASLTVNPLPRTVLE